MKRLDNVFVFNEAVSAVNRGETVKIRMVGQSMYPFLISDRDILTLGPKCDRRLKRGEIVLAKYLENYILHRIVSVEGDRTYILQGDSNLKAIEKVFYDDIAALLISVKRDRSIDCSNIFWRYGGLVWVRLRFMRKSLLKMIGLTLRITRWI